MRTDYINIIDKTWNHSNDINSKIKVIGIGTGGCNAVNYMFEKKIKGCHLIACTTDAQALEQSDIPTKIPLGQGLGAGLDPRKGEAEAINSQDIIEKTVFTDDIKMLFITTGLGGGTGTGAAPVIAKMAKDRGILTVAVVTMPFKEEEEAYRERALMGYDNLRDNVDSIIVIDNDKLLEHFPDTLMQEALPKVNEILMTAVQAIIAIIKDYGEFNIDFADAEKMLKNSGVAIIGYGTGSGENRIETAVKEAMDNPLIHDCDLRTARNLLVNIKAGKNEKGITVKDQSEIQEKIRKYTGENLIRYKRGISMTEEESFGDRLEILVIASGIEIDMEYNYDRGKNSIIEIDEADFVPKANNNILNSYENENSGRMMSHGDFSSFKIKFDFKENEVPVLCTREPSKINELENNPAMSRCRDNYLK